MTVLRRLGLGLIVMLLLGTGLACSNQPQERLLSAQESAVVLAYGEATAVGRCLPGEDRVHFQKLDAAAYGGKLAQADTADGASPGDAGSPDADLPDAGQGNQVPLWFNYQTISARRVDYGDFQIFEINLGDMEQDFSVPGPYGH